MMGANSEDDLAGKLPRGVGDLGLGNTNHDNKNSHKDEKCIKRMRLVNNEQTSVQISYKLLSRKSKAMLEELLHQWSLWHAEECSLSEGSDEELESGEETFFPALNVGADKSCTISFYMDNQVKKKLKTEDTPFNKGSAVPIYDRELSFALISDDGVANNERVLDIVNASRCFNCDVYGHSLKECPKPFNKVAVNKARKLHRLKSKKSKPPRVVTRYYQDTPGGKFDGLKPGFLDPETRKVLSLGELDPPPWLNRMRELGYPPGYLDLENEVQPSGITIYDNGDEDHEEIKECVNTNLTTPKRKMSVDFPGINATIPVHADRSRWAKPSIKPTGFNTRSNYNSLNHRIENSHELYIRGHSRNQSLWPPESSPFMSDQAYRYTYQHHAPGFPLLSNNANRYRDQRNQPSANYLPYAYQNSWSKFHG